MERPTRAAAPYIDPYRAGFAIGLVLLATFVLMGRGLGASGAVASTVSWLVSGVAPGHAAGNGFFADYLERGFRHPLETWLVFEVLGVVVGGFLSGLVAGRIRRTIERGPRISAGARLGLAFGGGALMGVGAMLARGCTSGQGLTGGALLNAGSWVFMLMVFAGAYALAGAMRGQWR